MWTALAWSVRVSYTFSDTNTCMTQVRHSGVKFFIYGSEQLGGHLHMDWNFKDIGININFIFLDIQKRQLRI